MPRWEPDALGRLQDSALTLFGERGFETTTVAAIAEHAGLSKRTFFRYFADKREVLFGGAPALERLMVEGVSSAPVSAGPLEAVKAALDAAAGMFEGRHRFAARRQQIINSNPELREREMIKLHTLAAAIAAALHERGVDDPGAMLTAEMGITVFRVAFERWVDPGASKRDLGSLIDDSLEELRAVATA